MGLAEGERGLELERRLKGGLCLGEGLPEPAALGKGPARDPTPWTTEATAGE